MRESHKTIIFVALAVSCIFIAIMSRPKIREVKMNERIGKSLFPKFTSPLQIQSLEIVTPNAGGEIRNFQIAERNGTWVIPSQDNYPADAKDRMGILGEALTDLPILEVIPTEHLSISDDFTHARYGVVDPTSEAATFGEGIGTKISVLENEEVIVNLIVGKPAHDMDTQESNDLRYVRIADQSPIYVTEIDLAKFPVDFDKWIKPNILDISTMDVRKLMFDDYSLDTSYAMTQNGIQKKVTPRFTGDFTLHYNPDSTDAAKWTLENWMLFKGRQFERYEKQETSASEEINFETLDKMLAVLSDLKLVGVTKKLAALLDWLENGAVLSELENAGESALSALEKTGYKFVTMRDIRAISVTPIPQLLSSEGDLFITMKDGIRYRIRFGGLTGTESETSENSEVKSVVNRYIFVTVDFDESIIPPPDIRAIQEILEDATEEEQEKIRLENVRNEKSNQREKDRFETTISEGKILARKFSSKFAPWFYVIDDDIYKTLRLNRQTLFRDK